MRRIIVVAAAIGMFGSVMLVSANMAPYPRKPVPPTTEPTTQPAPKPLPIPLPQQPAE